MNQYDVIRLALVLSVQAEIEGMKAENDKLKNYHHIDPVFLLNDFNAKAEQLRNIAAAHNEQL